MMRESFRLIEDADGDGALNMAVDSALLQSVQSGLSGATLRLYGWSRPTLSIGYAQDIAQGFNKKFIDDSHIPVVRRPTGGRAILHNDEVTYSLVIPSSSQFSGSLAHIYGFAQRAIKEALESLGIEVDPDSNEERLGKSASCFTTKTRHEISVGGCKVAGSAQRKLSRGTLQHGSIVLSHDRELYLSCFDWPDETARKKAKAVLNGINGGSHEPVLVERLRSAIIASFIAVYDINMVRGTLNVGEAKVANDIHNNAYA